MQVEVENPVLPIANDENEENDGVRRILEDLPEQPLPWVLQMFFTLNGFTLGLESLGLMYIINTKVEIPVAFLPTYGAIAFLPYSLKPLYGYFCERKFTSLPTLFAILLFSNGVLVLLTCLIPKGAIFVACLMGFLRGVTDSWAELCLGLTLIGRAKDISCNHTGYSYKSLASNFQAKAATCRNMGSTISPALTFVIFTVRQLRSSTQKELSSFDATALLTATAFIQILGSIFAVRRKGDFNTSSTNEGFLLVEALPADDSNQEQPATNESSSLTLRDDEQSRGSYSSVDESSFDALESGSQTESDKFNSRLNFALVGLLQATILVLALKGPIIEIFSHFMWKFLLGSLLLMTFSLGLGTCFSRMWVASHHAGLYLILKNAIPSDSMIIASFFYSIFQSSPATMQLLTLFGSAITTISSWSYGKYLSNYNTGNCFLLLIAGTTVLSSFASLGNIIVYNFSESQILVWVVIGVKALTTFFGEWEFLPNVILATTTLSKDNHVPRGLPTDHDHLSHQPSRESDSSVGVEYGTLISCIDFGDQLGALVTGPLVAMLQISRESNFENLDQFIFICFLFNLLSIGLIFLLRRKV